MTKITVYDDTAEMLQQKADELGVTVAEVMDALTYYVNELEV